MKMAITKTGLITMLLVFCAALGAQEYGDAPASYGDLVGWSGYFGGLPRLGSTCSNDPTPHSTPWTGDNDDGIVGTPFFDSWSDQNSITVSMEDGVGYLVCWVDANDNGVFEDTPGERYIYSQACLMPGQYTFTGITIKATQNFSTAGTNKVAVRVCCQENVGGPVMANINGYFWFGEIEDWLVDVEPAKPAVADTTLPDAREVAAYSHAITAANFPGAVTWTLVSGTLPSGMSLVQVGNDFLLSGTPGPGSGTGLQQYTFTVTASGTARTASRTLTLQVWPAPAAAPFADDFGGATGWELKGTWARTPAQAFSGYGMNLFTTLASEPATDFTDPTTDNMILTDGPQAIIPQLLPKPIWATSPHIDCSGLSSVMLRFHRWFSIGDWSHMKIQVSVDGSTWTTVWQPVQVPQWTPVSLYPVVDRVWTLIELDLTAVAANQPLVQVRFGVGWVNSAYEYYWGGSGYCGMCIDDVWVGQAMNAAATAQNFTITSPVQFTPTGYTTPQPVCYENGDHPFSVEITNNDSEDIVITSYEVGVTFPAPYGSGLGYVLAHQANCGWIPCGDWTTGMPQTVVGGGQTTSLSGNFHHTQMSYGWMNTHDVRIYLVGHTATTNRPVRLDAETHFCPYPGAMPGLEVWEAPYGSTGTDQLDNGDAAANLRDFGSVLVGGQSGEVYIICKSTTSNNFTVDPPTLWGPDFLDFTIYAPSPWPSQPQQAQNNCWFTVKFTPQSAGPKSCWIEFTHTAMNTGTPFRFEVKGLGVTSAPVLSVKLGSASGPQVSNGSAATGGLDFGQHDINAGPSAALVLYIENAGTQNLTLGTPVLTGAADFYLDLAGMSGSLAPGGSTTFSVYFDPTQFGSQAAMIEFAHNDTGTSTPFTLNVAGEGILSAPRIEVYEDQPPQPLAHGAAAAGRRNFGVQGVAAGASPSLLIEIRNTGWQTLDVSTPVLSGTHAGDFTLDLSQFLTQVAAGASTFFEIAFDPTAKGFKDAWVGFTHNDPAVTSPFMFGVAGYGDDPNGVIITSASMPNGEVAKPYAEYLQAAGGSQPYTWSFISGLLPLGLTVNGDGSITGMPANSGVYAFRVGVIDSSGGTEEHQVSLIISPEPGTVSKGSSAGGGCTADAGGSAAAFLLIMLILAATRRRKVME
jgi:MYXO-CTERM domain-containing protein